MSGPKQFLIVDDAEENVVFLSQILEDNGHQYRVTSNGRDALEAMRAQRPDLVLLDIMMPRKSGLAVFREMKGDESLKDVPVIIISGASDVTGVDVQTGEARAGGASDDFSQRFGEALAEKMQGIEPDGFIEKPIDPPVLVKKIEELLG